MKQILIISGKGGTGKTFLTASLAALAENKVMADCDVDAADLHLLLRQVIEEKHVFKSGQKPALDPTKCSQCARCVEACRFQAISQERDSISLDYISCEGCGVCSFVCPQRAIVMQENECGEYFLSRTKYGFMVHAKLGAAEENSGKLVAKVKQFAAEIGEKNKADYIIVDGPPGIGCPVIASLSGVDYAIVVVEPTLSGIHDMKRVLAVAEHFRINSAVVVNKYDLNRENTEAIKDWCKGKNIEVISCIPFSPRVVTSVIQGSPYVEVFSDDISKEITGVWQKVKQVCQGK